MADLTGRTRVRVGWFRIILQVEVSAPIVDTGRRFLPPPRAGEVDRRPRRTYWRDARGTDLLWLKISYAVGSYTVEQ